MRTGVRSRIADPVCPSGKSHQRAPVSTRGSPPPSRAPTVLCKSRSLLRAHKAGPARPPPASRSPCSSPTVSQFLRHADWSLSCPRPCRPLWPLPEPSGHSTVLCLPGVLLCAPFSEGPSLKSLPAVATAAPQPTSCCEVTVARPGRPLRPPPPAVSAAPRTAPGTRGPQGISRQRRGNTTGGRGDVGTLVAPGGV